VLYLRPRRSDDRRAAERSVVPLPFLTERRYVVAGLLTMLAAAALYGSVTLLPLYLRAENGAGSLDSGTVVTMGALGWVVGSATCGLVLGRLGYRVTALAGSLFLMAGATLLWATPSPAIWLAAAAQVTIGLGTGFVTATTLIHIQTVCPPERLGAFTSSVNLIRNVGAAIGINTLAAMQISSFKHAAATAEAPHDALVASFRHGFMVMAIGTVCCALAALLVPGRDAAVDSPERSTGALTRSTA
jgi:MFS family permease